jgi:hypothetical protein
LTPTTPTRERRSYPGAADPSDNKSGSLGPPVSVALPPARSGEGPNGPGIAPNRRLTSSRRAYPTALPVRQPSDQRSTPPEMGQPHPRKVLPRERKPIPGEGDPVRPPVGTSSRGLGHHAGPGVTSYLVRGPDEMSGLPTGRDPGSPSVGARTPTRSWGHVIPCPNPRPGVRGCRRARGLVPWWR